MTYTPRVTKSFELPTAIQQEIGRLASDHDLTPPARRVIAATPDMVRLLKNVLRVSRTYTADARKELRFDEILHLMGAIDV